MSRAGLARLLIGFGGGAFALYALLALKPLWLAIMVFVIGMVASSVAAGAVFSRLATSEEIRADLEDRVRNPPA